MALIKLTGISKVYDLGEVQVEALRGVALAIEAGEYLALVGPSGSGKSTLMNILGCLDRPTAGSYRLAGEEIAHPSGAERAVVRNRPVILVTHDPAVAQSARRVVVLRDGEITEDTPDFAQAMHNLHSGELAELDDPEQPARPK